MTAAELDRAAYCFAKMYSHEGLPRSDAHMLRNRFLGLLEEVGSRMQQQQEQQGIEDGGGAQQRQLQQYRRPCDVPTVGLVARTLLACAKTGVSPPPDFVRLVGNGGRVGNALYCVRQLSGYALLPVMYLFLLFTPPRPLSPPPAGLPLPLPLLGVPFAVHRRAACLGPRAPQVRGGGGGGAGFEGGGTGFNVLQLARASPGGERSPPGCPVSSSTIPRDL